MPEKVVLAYHDTQTLLKVLASLIILEYDIEQLEWTGRYTEKHMHDCVSSISMIRENIFKKLTE